LVDRPVEKAPETSASLDERRELLNMASEIVNNVAPEMYEERRKELDDMERKQRGWKFWKR
jgi:hypothetical protein